MNKRPMLRQNYSSREDRDANRDAMWTARDDDGCCLFAGFAFASLLGPCVPTIFDAAPKISTNANLTKRTVLRFISRFSPRFQAGAVQPRSVKLRVCAQLLHSAAKVAAHRKRVCKVTLLKISTGCVQRATCDRWLVC